MEPEMLTPREAAAVLGRSVQTLANWRHTKRGPAFIKLSNGLIQYAPEAVAAWVNRKTED
jgi:predicted DNA-binding transcriptional regulator AlpA